MSARWRRRCRTPAISTSEPLASEREAEQALARGDVLFVLNIPPDFSRRVDRGEQPQVLMDADATDPTAIANATAAVVALNATRAEPRPAGRHAGPAAAAAVPDRAACALQSGTAHRAEHRARTDRPDPDVLHAGHDVAGDHTRARAGHDGEPAGDAGAAGGGDAGQDHPLCRAGLCADRR